MSDISPQSCSCRRQGNSQDLLSGPYLSRDPRGKLTSFQVLFLPEASDYIASSAEESFSLAQSKDCRDFVSALKNSAKQENMCINVGVHDVASEHRLKNCLVWIDDKGEITQNYQKVHLFDVDIKGGPILKEST